MPPIRSMMSAVSGDGRVTLGRESIGSIRELSDSRALSCPVCGTTVILKAGAILAAHFAHLSGATCSHRDAEPETEQHISGKRLLEQWLRQQVPDGQVILEASLPETGQRADLLLIGALGQRIAIEFQCAEISGREWTRRHTLYRGSGFLDLWILGASRLVGTDGRYKCADLERRLYSAGAPLLYLDPIGDSWALGSLIRLRPAGESSDSWISGTLSVRPLSELAFPWALLNWPSKQGDSSPDNALKKPVTRPGVSKPGRNLDGIQPENSRIAFWLEQKFRVNPASLAPLFGVDIECGDSFACSQALWQASIYYQWVESRVGEGWHLGQVTTWALGNLPVAAKDHGTARRAISHFQTVLAAAGLIEIRGRAKTGKVIATISSLGKSIDVDAVVRAAAYRRTLKAGE